MRRLLPLIFLSAVAVLRADFLPPALVWDGDAFDAGDTSTGFESDNYCLGASSCAFGFEGGPYRIFTVTSPGYFVFSSSVSANFYGYSCNPGECITDGSLTGTVSGSTEMDGVDLDFSYSNSVTFCPSCVLEEFGYSDSQSTVVYLALGEYALAGLELFDSDSPENLSSFIVDASLVPAPEPRLGIALLGIALMMLLRACIRQKRKGSRIG